jgi:predicted phage terminase large subunit-like protein
MTYEDVLSDFDELLRRDFMTFVEHCFKQLNPHREFSDVPHLRVIAARLSACLQGNGPKRLMLCMPPRSLKSITVSVAFVAWLLGHYPWIRIIDASYGQDLADKHARDTRTVMTSPFYRRVFPHTCISKKNSIADFETTLQGFRMATSVNGVLTGRGADVLILDDILKPNEALSEVRREAVNEWYDNTLLSRLNNKETGIIIIVMHRLHENDLIGYLLGRGEKWEVLSFPAIAERDEDYVFQTAVGPFRYLRKVGEVLDPSRESLETLTATKSQIGSFNFDSQYQQNPTPVGGNMVKRDWFQYYDPAAPLPTFSTVVQSWDTANKSGELNDYSVCTTWGAYNGWYYLLDVYRQKLDYPTLRRKVIEQFTKHKPHVVLIEDRASGTQLIQDLKYELVSRIRPYGPPPQTDKIMRLHAQTAHFEAGKVLLPSTAPWLDEYVRELTSFPGAKHDDQVDSTTQALDYMSQGSGGMEVWKKLAGR